MIDGDKVLERLLESLSSFLVIGKRLNLSNGPGKWLRYDLNNVAWLTCRSRTLRSSTPKLTMMVVL